MRAGPTGRTGALCLLGLLIGLILFGVGRVRADWTPSAELRFRAVLLPDTLTVGDPIVLELAGSGPEAGTLLVPSFQDSVGPFALLGTEDVAVPKTPAGSADASDVASSFLRRVRLTAFQTGRLVVPPIPLLWISEGGDTLVAYSDSLRAEVRSVLPDTMSFADPQAALSQLRDVKGVVTLEPSRLWIWILLGALAAALAAWALFRVLRGRPAEVPEIAAAPPAPRIPPEIMFRTGLDELLARKLVESGEFKEYYAGLSLLLRGYLEGRFGIPAVEETEREIIEAASQDPRFAVSTVEWLRGWLRDADLVKFAKLGRLSADASRSTEEAADWVARTTREEEERARQAPQVPPALPPGTSGTQALASSTPPAAGATPPAAGATPPAAGATPPPPAVPNGPRARDGSAPSRISSDPASSVPGEEVER